MPFAQRMSSTVARHERLRRYAGWTADSLEEFDEAMRVQRVIDVLSWNDARREGRPGNERAYARPVQGAPLRVQGERTMCKPTLVSRARLFRRLFHRLSADPGSIPVVLVLLVLWTSMGVAGVTVAEPLGPSPVLAQSVGDENDAGE